jgi:hypothetical protein
MVFINQKMKISLFAPKNGANTVLPKEKGLSQLDAEVEILPSSAYEGTRDGKITAKKYV